jgi:hypothetical protein
VETALFSGISRIFTAGERGGDPVFLPAKMEKKESNSCGTQVQPERVVVQCF